MKLPMLYSFHLGCNLSDIKSFFRQYLSMSEEGLDEYKYASLMQKRWQVAVTALFQKNGARHTKQSDLSKNIPGSQNWMLNVKTCLKKKKKNCDEMCFFISAPLRGKWHRTSDTWLLCPWSSKQFLKRRRNSRRPICELCCLRCLLAWQVLTSGRLFCLIMDTLVIGQRWLHLHGRVNGRISGLCWTVTWFRPGQRGRETRDFMGSKLLWVQMDTGHSRLHLFSVLPLGLKNYSESNTA